MWFIAMATPMEPVAQPVPAACGAVCKLSVALMSRMVVVDGRVPISWITPPPTIRRAIRVSRVLTEMSGAVILLLAAVFGLAAASKLRARASFIAVLQNLVPRRFVTPLSFLIPALEFSLAAFLLSGIAPQKAIAAAIVLLLLFSMFLWKMRQRGLRGCACFGESSDEPSINSGMVRNVILIIAAASVLAQPGPISLVGPDLSSFLGRITIVIGVFCLWPCLVALVNTRNRLSTN